MSGIGCSVAELIVSFLTSKNASPELPFLNVETTFAHIKCPNGKEYHFLFGAAHPEVGPVSAETLLVVPQNVYDKWTAAFDTARKWKKTIRWGGRHKGGIQVALTGMRVD